MTLITWALLLLKKSRPFERLHRTLRSPPDVAKTAADMSSAMFKLIDWWPNMDPDNVHKQQERAIVLRNTWTLLPPALWGRLLVGR
jgi:hypothetical protein